MSGHASSGMMGAEGFGSEAVDDFGMSSSAGGSSGHVHSFSRGKRTTDPKQILEIGRDSEKLKAMKQIIQDMSKGVDQSEYFPHVVKCVADKSLELRKLVYMFLVRYAEELPDLALLSISTFQKGLKDPNQLIRASALRVLTSIRVPSIAQIMLLSLKQAATDMSPYVRKTVAHALPKVYDLAPIEKENLIEILTQLLHDRTTMVLGSVIMVFEELCPDRLDLIHQHYRKLCNVILDVDEWGQIAIMNLLTRYARTQFLDPNQSTAAQGTGESFYDEDEDTDEESSEDDEDEDDDDEDGEGKKKKKKAYMMDPDHRLLLRSVLPLLHSRNSGVVLAVAQLYHYLAPASEVQIVGKALVRMVASHRECQYIILSSIASLVLTRPETFRSHLKAFYVYTLDPRYVRLLKLEILTALADESNISSILREFQEYVKDSDTPFVTQTIQCIGRCASKLENVTESCLTGLMGLVTNSNRDVVAEAVVVIKKLLQLNPEAHKEIIVMMAKMSDKITVPMARASILWIIGEYSAQVPKIAPDVLRKVAKTFTQEEDIVKLQVLSLAAKLYLSNSKQTKLLTTYVLNLAKYDQSYDIRDRARLIRALLLTKDTKLHKRAKDFFLTEKPAPNLVSTFEDRDVQLGSLSYVLNRPCQGYIPLPDFPEEAPDPTVRDVEEKSWEKTTAGSLFADKAKGGSFYSDSEGTESDTESGSETESSSEEGSTSGSASGTESDTEDEDDGSATSPNSSETESEEGESSEEGASSSGSDSDEEEKKPKPQPASSSGGNLFDL